MSLLQIFVMIAFLAVCFFLIVIILLQKGRGGGLAGAFGGTSGSAFGAKTGDVFTWITVAFAGGYLLLAVLGNFTFRPQVAEAPKAVVGPVGGTTSTGTTDGAVETSPISVETTEGDTIDVTPGGTINVTPGAEGSDSLDVRLITSPPAGDEPAADGGTTPDADGGTEPATDGGTDGGETTPPADPPAESGGEGGGGQ